MAKKDAASKRLAEEIALAKLLKKVPPLFTLEELPAPEELPALLQLGGPWHGGLGSGGLGSYERDALERPILDAFKAFGLDHRSLSDWYSLVSHLTSVLFPTPRPPGAPRKWTDERLCQLLADVAVLKRKHPKSPDTDICKWLKKKWPNHAPARLRRVLQVARNPKHNIELGRVVSILERRLGPGATVSWVIARADELWGS